MKPLTTEQENKIISSVKKAVALVDAGDTPNEALEKVAREAKWGKKMIKFASHAYNTGRQNHQQEASKGILNKLATFSIASPEKIIQKMWPDEVKIASPVATYDFSPDFIRRNRAKTAAAMTKAAHANAEPEVEVPVVVDATQLMGKIATCRRKHANARRYAHQARVCTEKLFDKIGSYFEMSPIGRVKFAEFETCVNENIPEAAKLVDVIHANYKVADARAVGNEVVKYAEDASVYRMTKQAVVASKQAYITNNILTKVAAELKDLESALEARIEEKRSNWLGGAAIGGGIAATKNLLNNSLGPEAIESGVQKELNNLEDPAHEDELRTIKAQALISEMMEDDVIGSHDPSTVLNTYNELSQMAPSASTQPIAMRALLRRHLETNVEPFEAAEVSKLQGDMQPKNPLTTKSSYAIL